jgi:CcmD family protein
MSGTMYVLTAILVIWVGIFLYLLSLDRKVKKLEREVATHEG